MVSYKNTLSTMLLRLCSSLVLFALYLPVLLLIVFGFNDGSFALRWEGFSLRWYKEALQNRELFTAFFNSLFIAAMSTFLAVSFAFFYALWAYRKQHSRVTQASDALMSLPIFMPEIVIAIGLLIMLLRVMKPVAVNFGFSLDSLTSIIIGHTTLALGYAALVMRTRFKNYDIQQELAARDLGASRWDILQHVMLPQIFPGIAAACCISFAISLDDFYVSYFLSTGGSSVQTLPLYIWSLQGRRAMTPEINVVSSMLLLIAFIFFVLGLYLSQSGQEANSSKKG